MNVQKAQSALIGQLTLSVVSVGNVKPLTVIVSSCKKQYICIKYDIDIGSRYNVFALALKKKKNSAPGHNQVANLTVH